MTDHIKDKVIVITGSGSGYGRLTAQIAARRGAKVVGADINADGLAQVEAAIGTSGIFIAAVTDVTERDQVGQLAQRTIERFGAIDILINGAGTMPLAFYADHADAWKAWDQCIDTNIKGVLHGITAVYDQMLAQGRGHIVNISSIYGNHPVAGAGVYGATKAAVNAVSESLRVESQGKIKVTVVRPTVVLAGSNGSAAVNRPGTIGIVGQNFPAFMVNAAKLVAGTLSGAEADENSPKYWTIDPGHLADSIIYAIDQPWGVSIGDITVRATGEHYIL